VSLTIVIVMVVELEFSPRLLSAGLFSLWCCVGGATMATPPRDDEWVRLQAWNPNVLHLLFLCRIHTMAEDFVRASL
jgi:hypothetical protein